tara:strand:+ start:85 stop:816 length:732 start_codon:yes stop_codon:yes gene_type:complete
MKPKYLEIIFSESDIRRQITIPSFMTTDLAEETGLHLGDGSMNFYSNKGFYQLRGHIIDDREHYQKRIAFLYKSLYNLDVSLRDMGSTGVLGFQIWSDALVSFKHSVLGIQLGKKDNLSIPEAIDTKDLFFSFMRGLFDTDGSIYIENKRGKPYPRIDIRTISKRMSLDIMDRLSRYGIRATLYEQKRKEINWNTLYCIIVRGFDPIMNWIRFIGSNNPKHNEKFHLVELRVNGPAETFLDKE